MISRAMTIVTGLALGLSGWTSVYASGGEVPSSELGFGEWTFDEGTGMGTLEVTWDSDEILAGFQFDLPDVEITGASGGLTEAAGFGIAFNGDRILGFYQSLDGYVFETDGPEVLIELTFEINSDLDMIRYAAVLCANPDADAMEVTADDSIDLSSPPCPADLNGDAQVDGADLTIVLSHWGPCGLGDCIGDFNSDGEVGGADLTVLLASWGPCL